MTSKLPKILFREHMNISINVVTLKVCGSLNGSNSPLVFRNAASLSHQPAGVRVTEMQIFLNQPYTCKYHLIPALISMVNSVIH